MWCLTAGFAEEKHASFNKKARGAGVSLCIWYQIVFNISYNYETTLLPIKSKTKQNYPRIYHNDSNYMK